jgi:amino acid transporter
LLRTTSLTQLSAPLERDGGLVRGIGTWALAAAIVNAVVGAGIFSLPAAMAQAAGALAPWAYLLCSVAMAAVVTCFAEAGSRVPTSGGAYGYVEAAFGPLPGFIAGMLIWASSVLACGGIAAAIADALVSPTQFYGLARAGVILGVIGVIVAINLRGVRGAARLVTGATAIKLVPLLVFVIAGALASGALPATAALPASHADFGRAMILALFAFCGMETVLGASGEVSNPARTLPRALAAAMLFVLLLYISIQLVAERLLGADLAHAASPLAAAAARITPAAGLLLFAGATLSMAAWIASDILGAPRLLFAFARDRRLPASLALTGHFEGLAVLSSLDSAGIYVLGCAAAFVIHRRRLQTAGGSLHLRVLPLAALVGVGSMAVLICAAKPLEIFGLFATMGASAVIFVAMGRVAR